MTAFYTPSAKSRTSRQITSMVMLPQPREARRARQPMALQNFVNWAEMGVSGASG
jgi:hypothetical protein